MKTLKILTLLLIVALASGCGNSELHKVTDSFVEPLGSYIDTYGIGSIDKAKRTPDGTYLVTPIGRLVTVKYVKYATDKQYEKLKNDLARYYRNNKIVNKVYISQGGAVVIDCRD